MLLEMFNDSDYVSAAPHSAALNVFDLESRQVSRSDRPGRVPGADELLVRAGFAPLLPERHVESHIIK